MSVRALVAEHLSKSFGGTRALDDVGLSVSAGEVHGLLGENGSGKSTLIKILAGYHIPEAGGSLSVWGRSVELPLQAGDARALGLSFVHQDLALIKSLTAVENLRIVELATTRERRVSWSEERRRAREVFEKYGVNINPSAKVGDLTPVDRARLAIIRAVEQFRTPTGERTRGVLVLDEPTVFLPRGGIEQLFRLAREIAASGSAVLFVSHNLHEVRQVTDRVTVLRNGRVQRTVVTASVSDQDLVELIVGRRLAHLKQEPPQVELEEVEVSVKGLSGGILNDVSFNIRRGEILGVTGLMGSGFEELPYRLVGAENGTSGNLTVGSASHDLAALRPRQAVATGIALVPADRQNDGSIGSLSVGENVMLQVLPRYVKRLRLDRKRLHDEAQRLLKSFDVRPPNPKAMYRELSGGNQQKALLAKWLQNQPKLLLLHEPTQGVDVGARQQIFSIIRDTARSGMCVICASTDYEQLAAISHRVLILAEGSIVQSLEHDAITKERIAEQCYTSVSLQTSRAL